MSTRPPRLLIADDDAAIRRLIALVLRRENYQLTLVAGGVPALEHLQAETPDLVICDLNMPDLDGFQLLGAMRSVPALAGVPVLVVTAAGQPAQTSTKRTMRRSTTI